jgi:hypothetical protein
MIASEVKAMDRIYTWEMIGIYRAPNGYVLTIEGLTARTLLTRILVWHSGCTHVMSSLKKRRRTCAYLPSEN